MNDTPTHPAETASVTATKPRRPSWFDPELDNPNDYADPEENTPCTSTP